MADTMTSATTTAEQFVSLEREALDRWGKGDPGGFLELYTAGVTYFDPLTPARLDGRQAMADYYGPWTGKICIPRYEMVNPQVVVDGNLALLSYNLVNYVCDEHGNESVGTRWNSTTVFQRHGDAWKTIHSHWSFTQHPAFQTMTAEDTESMNG